MNRPLILLVVVLFATVGMLSAQDSIVPDRKQVRKARDRHLAFGFGTSFIRVKDQATSPLTYQGLQLIASKLDYQVHSDRIIKSLEADFSFGYLYTPMETPWYNPSHTSYFLAVRYNWLWKLNKLSGSKIHLYLGPELNVNGHFRVNYKYGNSAFTFDNYNGLGAAARLEVPFSWKARDVKVWFMNFKRRDRDLRLAWQLSSPFVSFLVRPTYVTITNFIDPELQARISEENTGGGIFTPLSIRSQTELYYILNNRNMLKLSYIWNFYHHDPGYNKVQSAYHGFLFSFVFKFNPNR